MSGADHEGLVVIGTPRSGTTLLRRLLNEHPNIACPGETNLLVACARFLHSEKIDGGLPIDVLTGLGFAGIPSAVVLERLRELAFGFLREHAAARGKQRWAEKTAFNAFHLANVERLCGDRVRYILLVRHGLDVALSIQDLCAQNGGYLAEIHAYVQRHPRPLEAFVHLWRDLTRDILDFGERNRQRSVLVRYEDLTADPDRELRRILELAGEAYDPQIVSRALARGADVGLGDWKTYRKAAVDVSSVGRWRKLMKTTLGDLGRIANPTLIRAGYDAIELDAEPTPEEARRRYELGIVLQGMTPRKG